MANKGRTPPELTTLATRQYGVISAQQLRELGYSRQLIVAEADRGRLLPLHQGVYAVGHRRLSWHSRCMAGVLGAEPNETGEAAWPAVASHATAAHLWGIFRFAPQTVHATAPIRRRAKRSFVVHFSSILDGEDRTVQEGIPVTAVPRTLLDLAIGSQPEKLERYLERAEELGIFDLRAFEALLARAGGHRGRGRLARALAIYRPDPAFTRSRFEKAFARAAVEGGLPAPSMNYLTDGFELDAYWRAERFVVELDLYETHGTRAAFERDRLRQEELKLAGIETIRVTGPRFKREPEQVIARVAALLERRRGELELP